MAKQDETSEQVRLNPGTVAKLRVIKAARRESFADIIDRLAGETINEEYDAIIGAAASVRKPAKQEPSRKLAAHEPAKV